MHVYNSQWHAAQKQSENMEHVALTFISVPGMKKVTKVAPIRRFFLLLGLNEVAGTNW